MVTPEGTSGIREVWETCIAQLQAAGVPQPEVDAELLMAHVLGMSRGQVQANIAIDAVTSQSEVAEIIALAGRRSAREPLQHLTGRAPFRHVNLAVGAGVFIPRPETEFVAQLAIDALEASAQSSPIAVDLGTGSGAIAIAMATEVPRARVYGVERSPEAFEWALRNATEFAGVNLHFVLGDLAEALPELDGSAAVVISNPPYIPTDAIPRDPEVRLFDPAVALYGGADGLDVVRAVSAAARRLLHPGGTLVIEHGELQGAGVREILKAGGWRAVATHPDLLGRDRAATALR